MFLAGVAVIALGTIQSQQMQAYVDEGCSPACLGCSHPVYPCKK